MKEGPRMGLSGPVAARERSVVSRVASGLRVMGEGVAELLWPTRCVLCDVPGTLLCDECRLELPYIDPLRACPFCGQAHGKFVCVDCNSFIVKHRGLAPDQRASARGDRDSCVSAHHDYDLRGSAGGSRAQHLVDRSQDVSRTNMSAPVNAQDRAQKEEIPVHGQSVSRRENVSRRDLHGSEENVSRPDPRARKERDSRSGQHDRKPLDQVASVFEFVDPCRKLITTYKDRKEVRLASVLAELLIGYIDPAWIAPGDTAIVVIPGRHHAIRERGFDHMKLVGEHLAQLTHLPLLAALVPNERGDQRGLSASSRQRNMHDSFLPNPSHPLAALPTRIILVDDVLTTGATLTSAATTLKQMGAEKVFGLTVARLP